MNCRLERVLPFAMPIAGLLILFLIGKATYDDRQDQALVVASPLPTTAIAHRETIKFARLPSVHIERLPPVLEVDDTDETGSPDSTQELGAETRQPPVLTINDPRIRPFDGSDLPTGARVVKSVADIEGEFPILAERAAPTPTQVAPTETASLVGALTAPKSTTFPELDLEPSTPVTSKPFPEFTFENEPIAAEVVPPAQPSETTHAVANDTTALLDFFPKDNSPYAAHVSDPPTSRLAFDSNFQTPTTSEQQTLTTDDTPKSTPASMEPTPTPAFDQIANETLVHGPSNETALTPPALPVTNVVDKVADQPSAWSPIDIRDVKVDTNVKTSQVANQEASYEGRQQGEAAVRLGFELVQRGAPYSARSRFIEALRTLARSLDDTNETASHTIALRRALAAYQEASDFFPKSTRPDDDINVAFVVGGHATDLLRHTDIAGMTPSQCVREYVAFAEQEFAKALGNEEIASRALYGLGRLEWATATTTSSSTQVRTYRAMALYQSAIVVNPKNFAAANELGVLLARNGKLTEAIAALNHSVTQSPQPTAWRNLASLYRKVGQLDQAERADYQASQALRQPSETPYAVANPKVEWVAPERFASASPANGELQVARLPMTKPLTVPAKAPTSQKTSVRRPWPFGRSTSR